MHARMRLTSLVESTSETRLSIFWMRLDVPGADVFQVLARVLLMFREVSGWYWLGIVVYSIVRESM
jgi:hypothetical protein